jgi:hypothetical protein
MKLYAEHDPFTGAVRLFHADATSFTRVLAGSPDPVLQTVQGPPEPLATISAELWQVALGQLVELLADEWPIARKEDPRV